MKQCARCGKGSQMQGKRKLLRGHYNPVNWSRKHPNLQWARVNGERVKVCTQCIKTFVKPPTAEETAKATKKETVAAEAKTAS